MTELASAVVLVTLALAGARAAAPATGKGPVTDTMWGRSGHVVVPTAARSAPLMANAPAVAAPRPAPFYTLLFRVATSEGVRHVAVLYAPSVRAVAGNRSVPGLGWRRANRRLVTLLRPSAVKLRPYRTPRSWPPGMKSLHGLDALAGR